MKLNYRTRLLVWFVVTVGALLTILGVVLGLRAERLTERQIDATLVPIAEARFRAITYGARPGELTGGGDYFTLVAPDGRVISYSIELPGPLTVDPALLEKALHGEMVFATVEADGAGRLRVAYLPVSERPGTTSVMIAGVPANILESETRSFEREVLGSVIALFALTAVSALLLTRRSTRPIETVTAAAQQVTAGNLTEKLPEVEDDEVGGLVNVFNDMLSRLESAFVAQRRFSSRVAHELRTPLTILKGETQVTLNRRRSVDEYEAQLVSVLEEVGKMERTVDDLLMFARYETGETDMPFRQVRLDSVIADAAKDLRPLALSRQVEFVAESAEDAVVFGDEQALSRLVCKLVENALHYTPVGGRVEVRATAKPDHTVLTVRDTGVGIAPEDLPHIFERFFRAHDSRNMHPNGTGIGLTLVRVIAQLHNAEINVKSLTDKGTTFTVVFPNSITSPLVE